MDIYCKVCREPWDADTLHEAAEEQGVSYRKMLAMFKAEGCEAFGWGGHNGNEVDGIHPIIAAYFDLCGDDIDGMEDEIGAWL